LPGFVVGPSKKKTVPVGSVEGGGCPEHAVAATAAVIVTVWPEFDGLGAVLTVMVEVPFTVSDSEPEEPL
jgi:hypothetical protein